MKRAKNGGEVMPRIGRLKIKGEEAVYHVMSRTALDGFVLGDVEKEFLLNLIKRLSRVYFAEVLGFCITPLNSLNNYVLHLCPEK